MLDNWRFLKRRENKHIEENNIKTDSKITYENFKTYFQNSTDVMYKKIIVGKEEVYLIYIYNLVNVDLIDNEILKPLMHIRR
jgi:hypothetical protein